MLEAINRILSMMLRMNLRGSRDVASGYATVAASPSAQDYWAIRKTATIRPSDG